MLTHKLRGKRDLAVRALLILTPLVNDRQVPDLCESAGKFEQTGLQVPGFADENAAVAVEYTVNTGFRRDARNDLDIRKRDRNGVAPRHVSHPPCQSAKDTTAPKLNSRILAR